MTVLLKFISQVDSFTASRDLKQLLGKRIACDCQIGQPCHVDVLIAKMFEPLEAMTLPKKRNPWLGPIRMVRSAPAAFSQAAIVAGISWPPLEHLVNDAVFTQFRNWASTQRLAADGPLGPEILQHVGVIGGRAALSEQSGSGPQRNALPPVVPFGLSRPGHFKQCLSLHEHSLPMEAPPGADWDLTFAAESMAELSNQLNLLRQRAAELIKELAKRLEKVSQLPERTATS